MIVGKFSVATETLRKLFLRAFSMSLYSIRRREEEEEEEEKGGALEEALGEALERRSLRSY